MQVTNIKFHSLQQGSEQWHNLRETVDFTASEVSAALGVNPHKTRDQLMHEKATGIKPEVSSYQQKIFDKGHDYEEMARVIVEKDIGEDLYPATITGECDGLTLLASLDGLTMDGDLAFEHKSSNEKLIAQIENDDKELSEHYTAQMSQQLLLSGAPVCKFVASKGTKDNWHEVDYHFNEKFAKWVITGLKQFKEDLEIYKQKLASGEISEPAKEAVVAEVIPGLPTIHYSMNGLALSSNLDEYKAKALKLVEKSKTPLETDQDFANAESMVKVFKEAETKISNISDQVLGEVSSIDAFVKDVKYIGEQIRQARLATEKQVKKRKEEIKTKLVMEAKTELDKFLSEASQKYNFIFQVNADFAKSIKGKRNTDSAENAIKTELARAKAELNEKKDLVQSNLDTLKEHNDYRFLFSDWSSIADKPHDDFVILVKLRIDEHKKAEEERLKAERERIRQEEEAKAKQEVKPEINDQAATLRNQRLKKAAQIVEEVQSSPVTEFKASPTETITISIKEYNELLLRSETLEVLEAAGVNNWDGYGEAMEMLKAS